MGTQNSTEGQADDDEDKPEIVGSIRCWRDLQRALVFRRPDGTHFASCDAEHKWEMPAWLPGPCPTWFRMRCLEASGGGSDSYETVGHQLMRAAPGLVSNEVDFASLFEGLPLERLEKIAEEGSDEKLLEWLQEHLPRCVKLVPKRRIKSFLDGCWEAIGDGVVF